MKDGPIRTGIKAIARAAFFIDAWGSRLIWRFQGRKPYKMAGSCQLCAKCCETPAIQVGVTVWRMPTLRKIFLWWQRTINGFHLISTHRSTRTFIFKCDHFNWETRRCDSYHSRPGMCRDYPRLLMWEADAPLLPGCGYKAISPNAQKVKQLLEEENLPPEKLAEIKAKLHLDDD